MECVLTSPLHSASLCTLIVFFTVRAEVAGGRYTKRSSRMPLCVRPDGGPFAIPTWPVVVCVCTVIDDTHGDASDHIPGF